MFDRAALWAAVEQNMDQHPQLTGAAADRPLFGGEIPERSGVPVAAVSGNLVTLDAGRLSGVTVGSVYASSEAEDAPRVQVIKGGPTWSTAELDATEAVNAPIAAGDFLIEREHAFDSAPMQVAIVPPRESRDEPLLQRVFQRVTALSGFAAAVREDTSDLLLALVRPQREHGKPLFAIAKGGRDSLPVHDADAVPELWVLNRGEHLLHEAMAVRLALESDLGSNPPQDLNTGPPGLETMPPAAGIEADRAIDLLAGNLTRYRRLLELKRLATESQASVGLELALIRYAPCEAAISGCMPVPGLGFRVVRVPGTEPVDALQATSGLPEATVLSFELYNSGVRDRYAYLFELMPDGAINVVFPERRLSTDSARIAAGERLDLSAAPIRAGLVLDTPGESSLVLLATAEPINPQLLTQQDYVQRNNSAPQRGSLNPLEALLVATLQGVSTRGSFTFETGEWGGSVYDYRVVANPFDARGRPNSN